MSEDSELKELLYVEKGEGDIFNYGLKVSS